MWTGDTLLHMHVRRRLHEHAFRGCRGLVDRRIDVTRILLQTTIGQNWVRSDFLQNIRLLDVHPWFLSTVCTHNRHSCLDPASWNAAIASGWICRAAIRVLGRSDSFYHNHSACVGIFQTFSGRSATSGRGSEHLLHLLLRIYRLYRWGTEHSLIFAINSR